MVLVPYRGIYFLYDNTSNGENKVLDKVLVPYRGIYFLYPEKHVVLKPEKEFSSPIGESIFSTMNTHVHGVVIIGSRPLSGNLFSLLDTR